VRVEGSLRDYEGRKHLFVYAISKIDNWNEMTHHFLGLSPLSSLLLTSSI
jgi:hypothetical protein